MKQMPLLLLPLLIVLLVGPHLAGVDIAATAAPPSSAAASTPAAGSPVTATASWSRATTAMAQTAAVYLTLTNAGDHDLQLTGATSPVCDQVQIHEHFTLANCEMVMREVSTLTVPAYGQLVFKPGSYHLMLIGLHHGLVQGSQVALTLTISGVQAPISATVQAVDAMGPQDCCCCDPSSAATPASAKH